MRQIVLDTETTGLEVERGHRIIEIGCVELINRRATGRFFHHYLNPERDVDQGARAVHGLTRERLEGEPKFAAIAPELLAFIEGAELIIHNAVFDLAFLDREFALLGGPAPVSVRANCQILDTLLLARRKHPGGSNRLDDLCVRYAIDNSRRTKHGALLDAELLAEIYIELIGARQAQLILSQTAIPAHASGAIVVLRERPVPLAERVTAEERAAHRRFVESLGESAIWQDYFS